MANTKGKASLTDNMGRNAPLGFDASQFAEQMTKSINANNAFTSNIGEKFEELNEISKSFDKWKDKNERFQEEIKKFPKEFKDSLNGEIDEIKKILNKAVDMLKAMSTKSEKKPINNTSEHGKIYDKNVLDKLNDIQKGIYQSTGYEKRGMSLEEKMAKATTEFSYHATQKGSIWSHDPHVVGAIEELNHAMLNALGAMAKSIKNEGGSSGGGGSGSSGSSGGFGDLFGKGYHSLSHRIARFAEHTTRNVAYAVNKEIGISFFQNIFDVADSIKMVSTLRQTLYLTQGITKEHEMTRKSIIEEAGSLERVRMTGASAVENQKALNHLMVMGITDSKLALKIETQAMHTAKLLNLSVDETVQLFGQMSLELGMTAGQISVVAHGMSSVQRELGITDKTLMHAVQASKEFALNMRNAGTLTGQASVSFIKMLAAAEKFGTGRTLQPLLQALSSSTHLFNEASAQTKALLFQAASGSARAMQSLQTGTIMQNPEALKDLVGGLQGVFNRMTGGRKLSELNPGELMRVNMAMKAAYGVEAGEFQRLIKTMKEASKTFDDRLKEAGNNAIEREKLIAEEVAHVTTSFQEMSSDADNFDDILKRFSKTRGTAAGVALEKELGLAAGTKDIEAMRSILQRNLTEQMKQAQKSGVKLSGIEEAQQQIASLNMNSSKSQFDNLTKALDENRMKLAVAEKAAQDPRTQIQQKLLEVNQRMVGIMQNIYSSLNALSVGMVLGGTSLWPYITQIFGPGLFKAFGWIKNLFTGGGTGWFAATMKGLGKTLTKLTGVLAIVELIWNGVKGFFGAAEAGQSGTTGTIYGALTGGNTTGSMFSSMLGIEKGSSGDKALGVAGATAYGTAIGAGIGTLIAPGVGTAIGAGIGALVSGLTELLKIVDPTGEAIDSLVNVIVEVAEDIWSVVQPIWEALKEAADEAWAEVKDVFSELWDMAKALWGDVLQPMLQPIFDFLKENKEIIMKVVKALAIMTVVLNPITITIALVIGSIYAFLKALKWTMQFVKIIIGNWHNQWEMFKQVFQVVLDFVVNNWNNSWNLFKKVFKFAIDYFTSGWNNLKTGWNTIVDFVSSTWKAIYDGAMEYIQPVIEFFQKLYDNIRQFVDHPIDFIQPILESINKAINPLAPGNPLGNAKEKVSGTLDEIGNFFRSINPFEKGGYVDRTQYGLLHAGEVVLNRNITDLLMSIMKRGPKEEAGSIQDEANVRSLPPKEGEDMEFAVQREIAEFSPPENVQMANEYLQSIAEYTATMARGIAEMNNKFDKLVSAMYNPLGRTAGKAAEDVIQTAESVIPRFPNLYNGLLNSSAKNITNLVFG